MIQAGMGMVGYSKVHHEYHEYNHRCNLNADGTYKADEVTMALLDSLLCHRLLSRSSSSSSSSSPSTVCNSCCWYLNMNHIEKK